MQEIIRAACTELNYSFHPKATVLADEGPRYTSVAESKLYQSWKCDLINMTTVPETPLAAELGLIYSAIAMVTDYDVCHGSEADVSVEVVDRAMKEFGKKIQDLLINVLCRVNEYDWTDTIRKKSRKAEKAIMSR